jgi:periplasmic divalent cation tolerance protein
MTDPGCLQVETAVGSREAAARMARVLVDEERAACVQVVGPVHSTYRWQGAVEQAEEWLCRCKTTAAQFEPLSARIRELHSYDTPEIIAFPIVAGDPAFLAWIRDTVRR